MAERLAYLEAVVGADITEFRKSMRDIRNDVGILSETISGIGGAARTMTFAFTAPMVALGTYAVQAASGFDAAMRNINSIMQLSETQFAGLSDEVMNFAKTTRAGVVPATEALYEIFSAGITDQERAMAVWKTSNQVAEAGVADLQQTTNAMTATMSAFNLETDQATRVGNVWSQMVKLGVGSLGDFLSNSQKILPLSAAMNISLEDMGATLAFLSQGGGGAAKAETAYAMMLSNMLKPTQAMTDTLKKLGVATGTELVAKFGSVSGAVIALKKAVDETTFNKMFSKTGLEAALRITGNVDQMTEAIAKFNDGLDTATLDAWGQQSQSFAFQWDLMRTSLEAVAITIGQAIMPLITPIIQGFSEFLQKVTEINPELVQLGVIFVGAIAAGAPLIWLLTSLISPIGLIIAGVATLAAAFATNFGGIRDTVNNIVTDILGDLQPLKDTIDKFMKDLFPEEVIPADYKPQEIAVDRIIKINPPEGSPPISLYDFYDGEGFKDIVSWDDFMKLATKGGWKGGAIKAGEIVTISGIPGLAAETGTLLGNGVVSATQSRIDGWTPTIKEAKTGSLLDRLGVAVTNAWPRLQANLESMWSQFTQWIDQQIPKLDEFGAKVLDSIAGWFDTSSSDFSGNSAAYNAVKDTLNTDVGAGVADAAGQFAAKFPALTTALKSLFEGVGKWIEAEAVPTLSRSIGFIGGKVARMLGEALNSAWDFLAGGDAGRAADGVKTAVLEPLNEGIKEGFGTGVLEDPFTTLAQKIGVAWDKMWVNVRKSAIDALDPIAVLVRDFGRDLKKTIADISEKALGLQIILDPNNTKLQADWGDAVITSDAAELSKKLEDSVNGYLDGATLGINAEDIVPQLTGAWGEKWAKELASDITDPNGLMKALNIAVATKDTTAMQVLVPVAIALNAANNPGASEMLTLMKSTGLDAETIAAFLTTYYRDNPVKLQEIETSLALLKVKPSTDTKVDTTELLPTSNGDGSDWISRAVANSGSAKVNLPVDATPVVTTVSDASKAWADSIVKNLPTDVMAAVTANQGNMSASADSMTAPFVNAFTTSFGAEGTVTIAWNTFLTTFITDAGTLATTATEKFPIVSTAGVTAFDAIKNSLSAADDKLLKFTADLNTLLSASPYKIVIDIETNGTMPTLPAGAQGKSDGAHAVGANYIPFDNYRAVLHKGELVLNKGAADEYRSQQALPIPKDTGGGVDNSSATFIINGVQNFDQFMREAKRRGYNLDKYRR